MGNQISNQIDTVVEQFGGPVDRNKKIGQTLLNLEQLDRRDLAQALVEPHIPQAELSQIICFLSFLKSESEVAKKIIRSYNPRFLEEPDINKDFGIYARFPSLFPKVQITPRVLELVLLKVNDGMGHTINQSLTNVVDFLVPNDTSRFRAIEFLQNVQPEVLVAAEERGVVTRFDIVSHPSDFPKLLALAPVTQNVGEKVLMKPYSHTILKQLLENNIGKITMGVLEKHANNFERSLILLRYYESPETLSDDLYQNVNLRALIYQFKMPKTTNQCAICFEDKESSVWYRCPENSTGQGALTCFECSVAVSLRCSTCRKHNMVLRV